MIADELRNQGYTVEEAFTQQNGAAVFFVTGHGVGTYVVDGDSGTCDSLIAAAQAQAT